MMDEIYIRKQVIWNDAIGYVNYSYVKDTSDCPVEASSALVLLVNAVNERFKIPVAYYFTNTANADEQANIDRVVLISLSEVYVEVVSRTFDGARPNVKTAELLGAEIWNPDKLDCTFKHPSTGKPVQVFLDICHMLKLVRNTFGNKGVIYDSDGGEIRWVWLVQLSDYQISQKLHAANKLRTPHIRFARSKISVII